MLKSMQGSKNRNGQKPQKGRKRGILGYSRSRIDAAARDIRGKERERRNEGFWIKEEDETLLGSPSQRSSAEDAGM